MASSSRPESLVVFACRLCGECCEGRGGIFPTPLEQELIAAFLGLTVEALRQEYLEPTPLGLAVKNRPGGGCIFNVEKKCRIHPVKPRLCRQWPFLPAILLHEEEFLAAKSVCPGFHPDCTYLDFLRWWREKVI